MTEDIFENESDAPDRYRLTSNVVDDYTLIVSYEKLVEVFGENDVMKMLNGRDDRWFLEKL